MARTVIFDVTAQTVDKTSASVRLGLVGDFAAFLVVKNADRGDANETYDYKIQESPDPMPGEDNGVEDVDATFFDLVTFTQIVLTSGQEKKTVTAPRAARVRVVADVGGTTPQADAKITLVGIGE